jgi:CubicO group peptidase (beta-lactamase class C family)/tetratricopeptide (TPR) repeat protein
MRNPCPLILLAVLAMPLHAAPVARQPSRDFDRFVSSEMAARKIPGLSIGYAQDGITWAKGYGFADLENRVPARADSSYRLASVTKPMTAVAIMRLVEQGKVDLDAEVQTYVPYFPRKPYPVTVRQLLGHLGGINAYVNPAAEQHFKQHKDTRQALEVFQDFDLVAEPGTRFRYTSYGYNLLGAVIEGASGQAYGEYMRAEIWQPLRMVSTRMDDPLALVPRRVRGYQLIDRQLKHSEFIDISSRFSAGGTRSSVIDMLRFGQGFSQGRLLSRSSIDLMGTSMVTKGGESTGYGMGWVTRPLDGKYLVSHDGVQPETSTYLFIFPSRRLSIAVAANLQRVELSAFAGRLFENVTGEAWQLAPYIRHAALRPHYLVMQGLYDEGRSNFEAGRPLTANDAGVVDAAFTAPRGEQLRLAGSVMAQALADSGKDLRGYSNVGAIGFFKDYVDLYRRDPAIPETRHFAPELEQAAATLYADWSRTRGTSVRSLDNAGDIAALERQMRKYRGAQAYPDHVAQLREAAFRLAGRGQPGSAMEAAQLAVDYYGDNDAAHILFGAIAILNGKRALGESAWRTALAAAPAGDANPASLNKLAYEISASGGDAITLLLAAIGLHPKDANLRDTLGEFYMQAGAKDKALLAYQQALDLDPRYPNAGAAKELVARLKQAH